MSNLLLLGCGGASPSAALPPGFHGALVKKAADQTAADYSSGTDVVAWDGEAYDTLSFHDNSSSNSRLTIPALLNGYYVVVTAMIALGAVTTNTAASVAILKNGAAFDGTGGSLRRNGAGVNGVATEVWAECSTHVVQVSTGDYFEARLTVDGDTSVTVVAAQSSFAIRVIGSSIAGALVKNSANLTTQNFSTAPNVGWNSEVYDSDAFHDTGSNTSRLTVASTYNTRYAIIRGSISMSLVTSSSGMSLQILRNGSETLYGGMFSTITGNDSNALIEVESQPIQVSTGDFFDLQLFCADTSVTLNASGSFFSIEILPATFEGVLAKLNADATANYTTPTDLAWNGTDVYDTAAAHDPASSNTKIIVPSAWNGKYGVVSALISGTTDLTSNSSVSIGIFKGASAAYDGFGGSGGHNGGATRPFVVTRTMPILLSTGDEFTARFWNGVDTSVTIEESKSSFGLRVLDP